MGVNLRDLLQLEQTTIQRFSGQILMVDSYNILYQFLAGMRQADGNLLRDSRNRVTSHLNGLFFRTINLMREGLKLGFVFDGTPHRLKYKTIRERIAVKEKAKEEWKLALEEGDLDRAKSQAQRTSRLTKDMLEESKHLLDLMGLPHVQAPSEGEAQASYMNNRGDAHGIISQDFDSILFGAQTVARNLALSGRRKLPGKKVWVNSPPEIINAARTFETLEITREQLVDLAILVGTDFNPGIRGIGPKTGLKLIKKHCDIHGILKEKGKEDEIPEVDEIRSIFLEPTVTDEYTLQWKDLDRDRIFELLCEEHDFSYHRVERELDKYDASRTQRSQKTLESFFG